MPSDDPHAVTRISPWRRNSRLTSRVAAPSAMRMPISRVRCVGDVRDHAVDADHAEQQRDRRRRSPASPARTRSAPSSLRQDLVERPHARHRQVRVDRPHGLLNLLQQRRRIRRARSGRVGHRSLDADSARPRTSPCSDRPVDDRRRRPRDSVVALVADDPDDRAPRAVASRGCACRSPRPAPSRTRARSSR